MPATHEKLNALLPDNANRRCFGISNPDNTGKIQYKLAAEILPTDNFTVAELQNFTIEKGTFAAE